MNNKQILFMLLLSASFLLGACSTKGHEEKMKTQKEAEDEFVATLTAADSSAVLTLCTQCMDLLKAKETDKALQNRIYATFRF